MKPVVQFINDAVFDTHRFPGHEIAHVQALDHPVWGADRIRTSKVIKKFSDGSFETLNTIYRPAKENKIVES
jgi:hypothetical protein